MTETLKGFQFPVRLGNHPALDFTNTAEFRSTERAVEFLHSYEHVVAWCRQAELLSEMDAAVLVDAAAQQPARAEQLFRQLVKLRETLYSILTSVIETGPQPSADLAVLNTLLEQAQRHRQLAPQSEQFTWVWTTPDSELARPLWMLAFQGAELLASESLARLRQCPNCGWLFLDTSRNGKRRWCSMDFCGSQMKSRRQYQRRKANGQ